MTAKTQHDRATVRRSYAMGRFGQIHLRRAGPAGGTSPLLLLHPSPLSGYVFDTFMAEMGRDRTVVAPDTPGFGMSDPPHDPPEIADYAAEMLNLVAALGFGLVDVMGYHTGALTAVEMARQQPPVVRKVVMISATVFTPEELAQFRKLYTPQSVDEKIGAASAGWPTFRDSFWPMGTDIARKANIYLEGRRNLDVSPWGHRAAFNYDLKTALPQLAQPVLVLNPQDDLWEYTGRAAPLLKNGRVHDLPGWNHGFLDAKTAEVAALVRGFLDGTG
jgi:pimeloyl-ACP methyl ester carboxylesterase